MSERQMPRFNPGEIGAHRVRDYVIRFLFGAAISLVAGLIGMKFGPKLGGVFLGFPAILPASLTLIEKKDGKEQASVDSIGAALGATGMIAFALIVSVTVIPWGVLPSLAVSLVVWLMVALGLYALVELVYGRQPHAP
jgi:hypothetical protein